jgi:hypothetical protein
MKQILTAATILVAMTTLAQADYRHRGYGNHHGSHQGRSYAAPLIGGLLLGGALGYGYNQYYRTWHTECQLEPVFDRRNRYLGEEEVCYRVQN